MRRRTPKILFACVLTLLLALGLSGVTMADDTVTLTASPNAKDALNLKRGTVVSNVFAYGESLSGLTLEEASRKANRSLSNLMDTNIRIVSNDTGATYLTSASDLGISWDRTGVDKQIADAVLDGNVLERYKKAKDYQIDPVNVNMGLKCDEASILQKLTDAISGWNSEPLNAEIGIINSLDPANAQTAVTPGHNGCSYDLAPSVHQFVQDIYDGKIEDSRKYDIDPHETVVEPEWTTERLEGWSIIGKYTTEYAVPRDQILANREQNLKTGIEHLTGRMFAPGETISALNLYGDVTEANGYKMAGTYVTGGHNNELGGGLCQVTTTLYNAVLLAELDVVHRRNHSYLVNYIPPGLDAMVYPQGGSDFKFANTSSDYIKLFGAINLETEFIHIYIVGHEDHGPGHKVVYESELMDVIPVQITRVEDPSLPIGWGSRHFVKQSDPINGAHARAWKCVYEDGVLVSRDLIHGTDTYKPMDCTISEAPDVNVVAGISNSQDGYYTTLATYFLDGTNVGNDPARWTVEERAAFNATMSALMAEKGYEWPDKGSEFSFDGRNLLPDETKNTAPSEGEGEGEGGGEGGAGEGEGEGGGAGEGEGGGEG